MKRAPYTVVDASPGLVSMQPMDFDPAKWADRPDPAIGIMHCIDQVGYLQRFLVSWADRHNEQLPDELVTLNELQRVLARVGLEAQERWMVRPGILPRAEQSEMPADGPAGGLGVSEMLRNADSLAERKRIDAERKRIDAKRVAGSAPLASMATSGYDAAKPATLDDELAQWCRATRSAVETIVIDEHDHATVYGKPGSSYVVIVERDGETWDSAAPFDSLDEAREWVATFGGLRARFGDGGQGGAK